MHFLVLGKGKTGSLVADVARERGTRSDRSTLQRMNTLRSYSGRIGWRGRVIDFTAPEAAVENMRAVLLWAGASWSAPPAGTHICRR